MNKLFFKILTATVFQNMSGVLDVSAIASDHTFMTEHMVFHRFINEQFNTDTIQSVVKDQFEYFGESLLTDDPYKDEFIHADSLISCMDLAINSLSQITGSNASSDVEEYLSVFLNTIVINNEKENLSKKMYKSKRLVNFDGIPINRDVREYVFYRIMNFAAKKKFALHKFWHSLTCAHLNNHHANKQYMSKITELYRTAESKGSFDELIAELDNKILHFFDNYEDKVYNPNFIVPIYQPVFLFQPTLTQMIVLPRYDSGCLLI